MPVIIKTATNNHGQQVPFNQPYNPADDNTWIMQERYYVPMDPLDTTKGVILNATTIPVSSAYQVQLDVPTSKGGNRLEVNVHGSDYQFPVPVTLSKDAQGQAQEVVYVKNDPNSTFHVGVDRVGGAQIDGNKGLQVNVTAVGGVTAAADGTLGIRTNITAIQNSSTTSGATALPINVRQYTGMDLSSGIYGNGLPVQQIGYAWHKIAEPDPDNPQSEMQAMPMSLEGIAGDPVYDNTGMYPQYGGMLPVKVCVVGMGTSEVPCDGNIGMQSCIRGVGYQQIQESNCVPVDLREILHSRVTTTGEDSNIPAVGGTMEFPDSMDVNIAAVSGLPTGSDPTLGVGTIATNSLQLRNEPIRTHQDGMAEVHVTGVTFPNSMTVSTNPLFPLNVCGAPDLEIPLPVDLYPPIKIDNDITHPIWMAGLTAGATIGITWDPDKKMNCNVTHVGGVDVKADGFGGLPVRGANSTIPVRVSPPAPWGGAATWNLPYPTRTDTHQYITATDAQVNVPTTITAHVDNFPSVQQVTGSVGVNNFPSAINIANWPREQEVSITSVKAGTVITVKSDRPLPTYKAYDPEHAVAPAPLLKENTVLPVPHPRWYRRVYDV